LDTVPELLVFRDYMIKQKYSRKICLAVSSIKNANVSFFHISVYKSRGQKLKAVYQ